MRLLSVALAGESTWDPAVLLAPEPATSWPVPVNMTLADVTSRVMPSQALQETVISPADIDPASGSITVHSRRGRGWAFRFEADGLRTGDLLMAAGRPVLLMRQEHSKLQFSTAFRALRVNEGTDELWLWAVLNSSTGLRARAAASAGSTPVSPVDPSRLAIPDPPTDWRFRRGQVEALAASLAVEAESRDAGQSWWRTTTLPTEQAWSAVLAARDPAVLTEGRPLGELLASIRTGRRSRPESESTSQLLPVWGPRQLRGFPITEYEGDSAAVIAEPGDLLVECYGSKGRTLIASELCAIGSGVMAVSLKHAEDAHWIADFLNSPGGLRQRAFRCIGSSEPILNAAGLAAIRVPLSTEGLELQGRTSAEPLATTLDQVLAL